MKKKVSETVLIAPLVVCGVLLLNLKLASASNFPFSSSKTLSGKEFVLQGVGKKSVFFVDAFEVGYYQEKKNMVINPLDNVAKHIEVRYFVNIPGNKLFNFNVDVMKDNYSDEELLTITDEIEMLREYYVDLKKGDSYKLTYIPEIGTSFEHNDVLKGVIKGERFAEILFSIWLGEKPFDDEIKEQILSLRNKLVEEKLNLLET